MVQLSRGHQFVVLGLAVGVALGLLSRQTDAAGIWLAALLGVSAALVALAQQTLP